MVKHPFMGIPKIGFSATGYVRRREWRLDFCIPALGDRNADGSGQSQISVRLAALQRS